MTDPVDDATRRWVDKSQLGELLAVLASAMDRADRERIAACYAEDSYDDHGVFKGTGHEFAEFICNSRAMSSMHHLLGQSVFEVTGDEAWGETFYNFHGLVGGTVVSAHGRYVDYFRRIDGRWKLSYRRVVPDVTPPGDDLEAYWQPSRDEGDPSYERRRAPDLPG